MKGSLRLRLLAGTLAWLLLSIAIAGWGLRALFLDHIAQQLQAQLLLQLDQLTAAVEWGADGRPAVPPMAADPRLEQPLSGLYWQIDQLGDAPRMAVARSRSLWDQALSLPPAPEGYRGYRVLDLHDAQGHRLLAVARTLQLPDDAAPPLRLAVAGDRALLDEPLQGFTRMLLMALGMLAAGLALAVVLQLQLALRPLQLLRQQLAAVRGGASARLQGPFPRELQPLATEFNHVLAENADMVQRARTQAGNLAHAVHTPLSVLANAAAQAPGPLGTLVREQVESARRQVDYHLARARAAAAVRATGLATPVLEPVRALLRTMQQLHAARGLRFELAPQAQDAAFRGEPQDLYELLGNLIDNAGKWARSRVVVDVRREGGQLCFTVDDDGPGIPQAQRERMFERGVRLDERRPGAGLGLDIVRGLADTYGGSVQAGPSALGGACLRLHLPAAV
ncbi:HAMP domain-containing sensor histidine kinase [Acidovorax sp. MR-S7]|uniref:sensor histidine kinase n=1 Tax=Acidovorax sp. MR-S7 TaxID=1268622 RepID=UPI000373D3B8|nr:HAMP domain-containing sensor histidine kinase [Acidovorax sp. MR-S7]GAD22331.1 signal transduction histidine kinase [Acidovorax sp. MR-S7]